MYNTIKNALDYLHGMAFHYIFTVSILLLLLLSVDIILAPQIFFAALLWIIIFSPIALVVTLTVSLSTRWQD